MEVGKAVCTYKCKVNHCNTVFHWGLFQVGWQFIENGRLILRVAMSQSDPTMNTQLQVTLQS